MSQKIDLQPAYILHTRDYRDTSLLVDFLTLDYGLIRAVARGVRGKRTQRRALLQVLQPLLISCSGRSELKTLSHFEAATAAFTLQGNRLFSALYINELLCRLLQAYESHPQIYRLYQSAMLSLMQDRSIEAVLRRFEFHLLAELGYAPDMLHEAVSGDDLQSTSRYQFDYLHGFIPASSDQDSAAANSFTGASIVALGNTLMQDTDQQFDTELLLPAKHFMRLALRPHLGNKPLNSRQLFISPTRAATACLPPVINKG